MTTPLPRELSVFLEGEDATVHLGQEVGAHLPEGVVVWLRGDLGAGKTTLTRGVLRAMGHAGAVKSPTYTIVEPYEGLERGALYHFDLYRLGDPEELEYLGLRDYRESGARLLIEWPERGGHRLPAPDLEIELVVEDNGRRATLTANTEVVLAVLAHLRL
jgi:tRNA threonylcarbamoyladenosine biosynthesis protein TsaE